MKVQGYDSAYPDNVAETSITIDIIRNAPSNSTLDITISEKQVRKNYMKHFIQSNKKVCFVAILRYWDGSEH